MRIAYADPPYLGLCKLYEHNHPDGLCWDYPETHRALIERLAADFPDGWAMSLHTPSLATILSLCPAGTRVGAWVKPFASFKRGVNPAYAWEPVLFTGGRRRTDGSERTARDWCAVGITLQRGFPGAKPEGFCFWLFELMGLRPEDEFVDLFHGSGAVSSAWESYRRQLRVFA